MKKMLSAFGLLLLSLSLFAQSNTGGGVMNASEIIIRFESNDMEQLRDIGRVVSIDKVGNGEVVAYANPEELERFLAWGIPYEIMEKDIPSEEALNMMPFEDIRNQRSAWDYYPTYEAYEALMLGFESDYPDICRVVDFGTTVKGRKLLACKLSKNVTVREAEPQFLWTSTMHGDETTGYVLMLRLIDYLLSGYGTDERITYLLDNMELWINPLANPDGTYNGGNHTVANSIRNNGAYKDLNRNYRDWIYGNHPDGNDWQLETIAFMELQEQEKFVMAVNVHGGETVCNYPWDNTTARHVDNEWWKMVCREYADTVHQYAPSGYMTVLDNGITNGSDWYQVSGGRQDYANFYDGCREFTLEISSTKCPAAAQLPNFWEYNYRSFMNYTQQSLYGMQGTVTDSATGQPLEAKIFIEGHDNDYSFVTTDPRVGYYARPVKGGSYKVTFSANGYYATTLEVNLLDRELVRVDVELAAVLDAPVADFGASLTQVSLGESVQFTDLSDNSPIAWEWFFEGGEPETSSEQHPVVVYNRYGTFDVTLDVANRGGSNSLTKEGYISVPVSVENSREMPSVNIYPNPVRKGCALSVRAYNKIDRIEIFNMNGQLVQRINPEKDRCTFFVPDMEGGMYVVQITIGEDIAKSIIQVF